MSRQFWQETLVWATAAGTAVANTVTETILVPNVVIPANYMQDGRLLRVRAFGAYGTTVTPTVAFAIRWGGVAGTVLGKSTAVTLTSGVGGGASMTAMWSLEALIQTRANGSSGSLFTMGEAIMYTNTAAVAGTVTHYGLPVPIASGTTGGTTPIAVTADLTVDTSLSLTALWSAANAANSIQATNFLIEALN